MLLHATAAVSGGAAGAAPALLRLGHVLATASAQPLRSLLLSRQQHSNAVGGSAAPAKIGFIGLGHMGAGMAQHLLAAGYRLVLYDENRLALDRAMQAADHVQQQAPPGSPAERCAAEAAMSPAEVAATPGVSVLFTMLPSVAACKDVYLGPRGVLAPKSGIMPSVLVDCSTCDPKTARVLAAKAASTSRSRNAPPPPPGLPSDSPVMLDAPVTGNVGGAEHGTLSFLVGGEARALGVVEPLLRSMGKRVTWCGDAGDAQAAKLCSALVQASTMAATAEALALAKRLGVNPAVMTDVLNSGSGRSWTSVTYNPVPGLAKDVPAAQGYKHGLRTSMLLDQLRMVLAAAADSHSPVPIARQAVELYGQVLDEGMGDLDYGAIYRYIYGSGCEVNTEWKKGEQLFSSHSP